jgi:hypothetical protein
MNDPKVIKDIKIFDNITLENLHELLLDKTITLKEFYEVLETGKFEDDCIKIYRKKHSKK